MAKCIITYKGVDYDYEDFAEKLHDGLLNELIKDGTVDSAKFTDKIEGKPKEDKPVVVKSGVSEVFNSNPELVNIGTQEQYSQYLDTVFPDSQLKNIVYHSSPNKIEKFRDSMFGNYFSYSPIKNVYGNVIHNILLNVKNPLVKPKSTDSTEVKIKYDKEYRNYNNPSSLNDASIEASTVTENGTQVRVKNPEQIHILGGKEDLEGFKGFISNEIKNKKEVIKPKLKESGGVNSQGLLKLAYRYNSLSKSEKRSEAGVNLFKNIKDKAKELDLIFELFGKGKISLYNINKNGEKGIKVVTPGVKRNPNIIQEEKDAAEEYRAAKAMPANDIYHSIALDVVNGETFNLKEFIAFTDKNIPIKNTFLFNGKNPIKLENYAGQLSSRTGDDFKDTIGSDEKIGKDAAQALIDYVGENGNELAKQYVLEQYREANVNDANQGKSNEEIAYLQDLEDKLKLENEEVRNIDEALNNANREELNQIKVELKDEKNRNEENADRIVAEHGGIKIGSESPFNESESEQGPFYEIENEQDSYNEPKTDIIRGEEYGDDVFQKPAELQYAEGQLKKAEIELTASKKALDAKRKELDKGITEDAEDLFGERKSTDVTSLFDERVDLGAREEALAPFKQRYDNAQKDFAKQTEKVKEIEDKGDAQTSLFQKKSVNKGAIDKVISAMQKAMPKVKIVYDEKLKAAGRWSPSNNTITVNPFYAGLDTPIHEAGHILIDAMGYNNKVIQSAIKQLRNTPLYKETKRRYKELNEEQLDKEVLAEAIGREGANIFDKEADKSKFKAYLDYIYDWLKQKLGLDKNVAKSLAKQIIGGIGTKDLEGVATGKEQLQKAEPKKKSPIGLRPLTLQQYASEHGFSYEAETEKFEEASENLNEAESNLKELQLSGTEEEVAEAEKAFEAARKAFSIAGKKIFEYKTYKKDFAKVQEILNAKSLNDYTDVELQNLINELHGFGNRASKVFRDQAMIKLAMRAVKAQQKVFEGMEGYIEDLAKTKDISPLQKKILHHSHFSENNPDMQAVSLEFGKAIMDKITDANTKKATHEKLGQKVIAEENKKLGIVGAQANRFSSDSAKYFEWMINKDGELLTIDEAKNQGLSDAKINYLKFTRETIADYKGQLEEGDFENAVMDAIRIDKGFMEAYKSEGLLPAFSYYLGGGANNLGKVRIMYNGEIKSYSEIEKDILASADRKSIVSMAKALFDLLVANIMARKQLKRGFNVDEKQNPLELNAASEYSLNEKGQLMSKFDKPRAKDRGYSKDFYRAMNQFIDESAHAKHISKIMPLVDSVEYLNKNGYLEGGFAAKPNVAQWIEEWKALHIFKEPYVNDPVLDASIKLMRKLVASTTMWFNIPANVLNVFMGNYNSFKQENGKTLITGNKRLFGGKDNRRGYGLDIIKKYNIVNQDYDSQPNMKAGSILSKLGTIGTQIGEYQIQGSLGLGLLSEEEFDSFEYTEDKYGNEILTLKKGVDEAKIKARMLQVKNRVTDIQGKYPDEDRRNIMRGEIGKAAFQFKVWMPDWFKERFSAKYINAYGVQKEGSFTQLMREGTKQIKKDIKDKGMTKALWENKAFMSNMKGLMTIGTLMALAHQDDDDDNKKKGALNFQNALSQVLFIFDLEQDKYMVSNPIAVLGKSKDLISAFDALVTNDETAFDKVRRVTPSNKALNLIEMVTK